MIRLFSINDPAPPTLSGGLLFSRPSLQRSSPALGASAALTPQVLAHQVRARADELLAEAAARQTPAQRAKEQADSKEAEKRSRASQVPELDPDVLAGITKHLAAKHRVPDRVAGEAVMTAYEEVRRKAATPRATPAGPAGPQADQTSPTARMAPPPPGSVESRASTDASRRRRRPTP